MLAKWEKYKIKFSMQARGFIREVETFPKYAKHGTGWKKSFKRGKNFSYKETLSIRGVKKLGN